MVFYNVMGALYCPQRFTYATSKATTW